MMNLDLGGLESIVSPTKENIRHYLRYMSVEQPYVILSTKRHEFIQSAYTGENYVVEYSLDHGETQWCCTVDYDQACELFESFRSGDIEYQTAVNWQRTKSNIVWQAPECSSEIVILLIVIIFLIAITIWNTLY